MATKEQFFIKANKKAPTTVQVGNYLGTQNKDGIFIVENRTFADFLAANYGKEIKQLPQKRKPKAKTTEVKTEKPEGETK